MARKTSNAGPAWLALVASGLGLVAAVCAPVAPARAQALRVERWSEADKATLASMQLRRLPPPPADPSNAHEAKPAAVALGRQLFSDARLSANGRVSCASCHDPARGFQDGLPVGHGVGTGARRTMPLAGAAQGPWFFWDGRKDSLWSQALGPLEDPAEHGANRAQLVRLLQAHYRAQYEGVFGAFPDLQGVPSDASPVGSAQQRQAWSRMPEAQRDAVNRAFANLGKALAAYERTIGFEESRFDRYVAAVLAKDPARQQVLNAQELDGLKLFIGKAQCATCHNGPMLSDLSFHNTGVPLRDALNPDRGRAAGARKVVADEFNCLGRYSDAGVDACQELRFITTDDPGMEGAFKTPSLRGAAQRAPYMHAGQIATLEEAVAHYARSPVAGVGRSELLQAGRKRIALTSEEAGALVAFVRTLSAAEEPAARP